jgi:hypothetical protein
MDEAGTSKHDPYAVVAGIVVHGDDQIIPLEEHLEYLVQKHIPAEDREGFVFHMTNVWSGTKYYKNRDIWPIERRVEIMDDLVEVPERFELPIAFGFVDKADHVKRHPGIADDTKKVGIFTHAVAFSTCTLVVEKLMREVWPDEIAQLVAEDNDHAQATVRSVHASYRNPRDPMYSEIDHELLPHQRIRGSVQFAGKSESRPLQVADMCAFFIRGHLNGRSNAERFYDRLKRRMIVLPKGEKSPYDS